MSLRTSLYDSLRVQLVQASTDTDATGWTSTYVDMRDKTKVMFTIVRNAVGGTGDDLDTFQLLQATSSGGAGAKAVTGAVISDGSSAIDDKDSEAGDQLTIEVDAGQLDFENGFHFVAAQVALGGTDNGTNTVSCIAVSVPTHPTKLINATTTGWAIKNGG